MWSDFYSSFHKYYFYKQKKPSTWTFNGNYITSVWAVMREGIGAKLCSIDYDCGRNIWLKKNATIYSNRSTACVLSHEHHLPCCQWALARAFPCCWHRICRCDLLFFALVENHTRALHNRIIGSKVAMQKINRYNLENHARFFFASIISCYFACFNFFKN